MTTKYPIAIEVFPYPKSDGCGYLASDDPVTDDVRQHCSHWLLNLPFGDDSDFVEVYYHGDMPSIAQKHRINSEIFKFYFRLRD